MSFRLSAEIRSMLDDLAGEESKDRSELVRELLTVGLKEKKIQKAIELYKRGKATLWKAARTADISIWKMMEILRERGIEAQYGVKELEEDLKALKESA